jgi:hydrogenase nickel incorporation protein HypA/HybF
VNEAATMHEYSLVQAMFDQIEQVARQRGAIAVHSVRVQIGAAANVDVPLLRTAYDTFRERTICEHAPLEVDEVAVRWVCPAGHGDIAPGTRLVCARCGRPARMDGGDEIVLERIELEVQ